MNTDLLIVIGIWWAGAFVAWLAIKNNWRNLGNIVIRGVPEDSVGVIVWIACVAWFPLAIVWVGAWIVEFVAVLINRWTK